ncbi:unnamed protein product [Linum trigynum]|uniref:Uncharacterized protein n=1 Tax=Linum trigynum TaxID=586398 RepID=A0AAV2E546_9ROSI
MYYGAYCPCHTPPRVSSDRAVRRLGSGYVGNRAYSSGFSVIVLTGTEGGNGGGGGGCDYDHEADGVSWMLPDGIVAAEGG